MSATQVLDRPAATLTDTNGHSREVPLPIEKVWTLQDMMAEAGIAEPHTVEGRVMHNGSVVTDFTAEIADQDQVAVVPNIFMG